MAEKNRRLVLDGDIIFPITKQENVIGLQKTIKEKLPIVSPTAPNQLIERQVWIDTNEEDENTQQASNVNNIEDNLENSSNTVIEDNLSNDAIEDNTEDPQTSNIDVIEDNLENNPNTTIEDNLEH